MSAIETNVGILGLGNMGGAIARGLLKGGYPAERLFGFDAYASVLDAFGGTACTSVDALCQACDVLVVAVKPHHVVSVLGGIAEPPSVIVSVAAGLAVAPIAAAVPDTAVVRAMPNTAAAVGRSTTALFADETTEASACAAAEDVFSRIGGVFWVADESKMHPATALVGSAPAFVYVFAEALADAAVAHGIGRMDARRAAASMIAGAGALLDAHEGSPADLKDGVASPGGTTIAGLNALEATGLRASVIEAFRATVARSEEMGK